MVRIATVDGHPVFRQGLIGVLGRTPDFEVVGETGSAAELTARVEELNPDVVLMDVLLGGEDGIEATAELHRRYPQVKVLILTACASRDHLVRAMEAGAVGYLLKGAELSELVDSVRLAAKGGAVFSHAMAEELTGAFLGRCRSDNAIVGLRLTPREKEILSLAAKGAANKEIAQRCGINETTVKAHFRNIKEKLNTKNRSSAVAVAVAKGLLHASVFI